MVSWKCWCKKSCCWTKFIWCLNAKCFLNSLMISLFNFLSSCKNFNKFQWTLRTPFWLNFPSIYSFFSISVSIHFCEQFTQLSCSYHKWKTCYVTRSRFSKLQVAYISSIFAKNKSFRMAILFFSFYYWYWHPFHFFWRSALSKIVIGL